jgi:hypothetical protein
MDLQTLLNHAFPIKSARGKLRCLLPPRSIKSTISFSRAVRHPPFPPLYSYRGRLIGGAAGCVVAGRLAAADPDLRILVLEAGPPTYNNPAHRQPACFLSHLAPSSRTVRVHASRPSAALGDRSTLVPCGQCLGGGGSVNCTSVSPYFSGGEKEKKTANRHGGTYVCCNR